MNKPVLPVSSLSLKLPTADRLDRRPIASRRRGRFRRSSKAR